jgi:excisionase family DNA binding protein
MQKSSQTLKILTVDEVAEILRVHRSTISKEI